MRIRAIADNQYASTPARVNEKRDSAEFQEQLKRETAQEQKEESSEEQKREELHEAVEAFGADEQTRQNGIHAETHFSGPGLRVVLKDGSGAIIRQMSGDEFLKLREAIAGRGKLLDRKA